MVARSSHMTLERGKTKKFFVAEKFYGRCRVHRFIGTVGHNLGQIGVCEISWRRYRNKKVIPL